MSALLVLVSLLSVPLESGVGEVLNDFHRAASEADGDRYFAHFADDGVFVGTDATEIWSVKAFKAYAEPFFSKGKGWTYHPDRDTRLIRHSADRKTAWFYETLRHEKYGVLRGSGALSRVGNTWKINQYVLSFAVPNGVAKDVVERIKKAGSE